MLARVILAGPSQCEPLMLESMALTQTDDLQANERQVNKVYLISVWGYGYELSKQ